MAPLRRRFRSLDDEETLRILARNLDEGIYITNADGQILDANPAFLDMFGVRSVEELGDYHVSSLIADPDRRTLELALIERDGSVRNFELTIVRPDGERRTVLDTAYRVRDPQSGESFYHGILVDITRRKKLEDQLRDQSVRDALTGCYNRRYLFSLSDRLSEERVSNWGCIYIDIDHFKKYNDVFGHQSGDKILVKMSRFLVRQVRAEEAIIRIGGDEFLIVLIGESSTETERVASRLETAAARSAPVPFSLGWTVRAANEKLQRTVDRADRELIGVRVLSRGAGWGRPGGLFERRGVGKAS